MQKPQLVFFGTGPVSLGTLEGIAGHFDIEAIVTKPDRTIHGKTHDHPVKAWGNAHGIAVYSVADKTELSDLFQNRPFSSKLGLVVDFGIIIAQDVIGYFSLGILNSHFSLLPLLRGADPITFAILGGLSETGVSIMTIVQAMDVGDLIAQKKYALPATITGPALTKELVNLSNQMLIEMVPRYVAGDITPSPQDPTIPSTYSRKLTREDGIIDWTKPAAQIEREIRAFLGWPGSRTTLLSRDVIVTKAHLGSLQNRSWDMSTKLYRGAPLFLENPSELGIFLDDGETPLRDAPVLIIDRLKPAGKKEMAAADFLRGIKS